ncbi:glycosyltransferase family protein [Oricola thermophila]|uniref:Glycosyltransferase family 4 protein n=1 Tax=Oricola thermophila TaxID=2742145 RepID=A0A6N1VIG2_9HYPH|nr:glycosyltransferase [Oricola thermophila]QKV18777.1 hypothetical protein HTY61_10105 [Oricola thermophila]
MRRKPKIVLAPMNFANMPIQIVRELKRRGFEAEHLQYTAGEGHKFGYELDREINIRELDGRINSNISALTEYIERDFDIFHFWNKSFFFETYYQEYTGFDIPLIKARNKRIAYRFTGFDARLPSRDLDVNPYSPFRYGYEHPYDEDLQKRYLAFLEEYVDQFLVQDPEMAQFSPGNPKIIPRALNLSEWPFVGIGKTDRPLVVHAPSNGPVKGTKFVQAAVDTLQSEGLAFDYKSIEGMAHKDAIEWYKRADIIVDQLLIGATGVLTLEAWALGKPCVVHLREDLFKPFYKTGELPVANANPDTITNVLRDLIKDHDWRAHLSREGRKTVEEFHDIAKVIDDYIETYDAMISAEPVRPTGTGDIEYLRCQAELARDLIIFNADDSIQHSGNPLRRLDGDEKLAVLQKVLPAFLVWPIRKLVNLRRACFRIRDRTRRRVQGFLARRGAHGPRTP